MSSVHTMEDIVTRLVRRFPPAVAPHLRMALYERLGRMCEDSEVGEQIYHCVCRAAADAVGKRDAGRYFAHVVMLRLREADLLAHSDL